MSEKTREVPQLADTTYAHTLVIKSTLGAWGPLLWAQIPENQEGGPWPLWYIESWNRMTHGPCIHEYF